MFVIEVRTSAVIYLYIRGITNSNCCTYTVFIYLRFFFFYYYCWSRSIFTDHMNVLFFVLLFRSFEAVKVSSTSFTSGLYNWNWYLNSLLLSLKVKLKPYRTIELLSFLFKNVKLYNKFKLYKSKKKKSQEPFVHINWEIWWFSIK